MTQTVDDRIFRQAAQLHQAGQFEEAVAHYRKAIELNPRHAEAFGNLGIALQQLGRLEESAAAYQKAVALNPQLAGALNNLGNVLKALGRFDEAIGFYRQAIQARPDYVEALVNLGNAYEEIDAHHDAIASYRRALAIKPDFAGALNNLGNVHLIAGQCDESIAAFRRALALEPAYGDAWHNLGRALLIAGEFDECLASHDRAIACQPDVSPVHSSKLYALNFYPRYDPQAILREAKRFNEIHARPLGKEIQPHCNDRSPDRRLRIGYVSPDFCDHCQSFFTDPLLSNHDPGQFEIYIYSSVAKPDPVTERLKRYPQIWRDVARLTNERVAQIVREDRIDILVDLSMHMGQNRLLLFARKPAPVQVTWLAYPGTTGLEAIDYRITDPYLDPVGKHDDWYAEKSIRLADSFWCYNPLTAEPPVNDLPALKNGYVTFGCLNNFCKIHEGLLKTWKRVLDAVPTSRLLLLVPAGSTRQRVLDQLGVDPKRIEFVPFQRRVEYLKTYHRIDLGLDTFPVNGHTTSLDSLWMGVPVVSQFGESALSRAGLSQTTNLGLAKDFLADTADDYVALAAKWANNLTGLGELRKTLRSRMEKSPLMDGARFARNMEVAYRDIWRKYCEQPGAAR
jgi:protein O-GlcNAc transferase